MTSLGNPARRTHLRNILNQIREPQGWQAVQKVVGEYNTPELRESLRELSIELSNPQARQQLRTIISQAANSSVDLSQIQDEFAEISEITCKNKKLPGGQVSSNLL